MLFTIISILICSYLLSYVLYFPSLAISYKVGAIDIPNPRKTHTLPTARAGGLSFFVVFSSLLILSPVNSELKIPLIFGGTTMFLVGFLDDTLSLSPIQKLAGQFSAASIYIFLEGEKPLAEGILTLIWLIFLSNATNLIDGLNGLAGGICASESLCLAVMALCIGNFNIFLCALILFGSILGFLPHNFPKAKIFMGDCGALFLGFTLAALSSKLIFESQSITCLLSTLLIFRVPTYDTNLSIVRRLIKRKNPLKSDKEHFHHQLLKNGFTKECTAFALVTLSLFFGLIGIIISFI